MRTGERNVAKTTLVFHLNSTGLSFDNPSRISAALTNQRYLFCSPGASRRQNVWINSPDLSFGSNHVLFGGMIAPASAMSMS